jgi:hypothetical protein
MSTGQTEDQLRDDIERTRQQLGETAEALAAKADVMAWAKQKANQVRHQAASGWMSGPSAVAAAAAVVFVGIAIVLWRRR